MFMNVIDEIDIRAQNKKFFEYLNIILLYLLLTYICTRKWHYLELTHKS